MGRVHFGPPGAEGIGRVTVNAPASDNIQVFLEGRYFGHAPMTIYSVPKGDYIVEGRFADGRQVSRPVSVSENEEATVDLSQGKIESPGGKPSGGMFGGEISPERLLATKILLGAAAASLVFGITFGILELKAESDWQNATTQMEQDSIADRGRRDATLANVGYVLTGACVIGAAVAGYPMLIKPSGEKSTMALMVAPVASPTLTGGTLVLRF